MSTNYCHTVVNRQKWPLWGFPRKLDFKHNFKKFAFCRREKCHSILEGLPKSQLMNKNRRVMNPLCFVWLNSSVSHPLLNGLHWTLDSPVSGHDRQSRGGRGSRRPPGSRWTARSVSSSRWSRRLSRGSGGVICDILIPIACLVLFFICNSAGI